MLERDLEPRFRTMADSVPVLLWIADPDGSMTFVNRRWLDLTGRTQDEVQGDGWAASVHADDTDRVAATRRQAFERRAPFEVEYRLRRADGSWRRVLDQAVPVQDGDRITAFVGIGIDLTEREDADRALRRSQEDRDVAMTAGRMGTFDLDLATGHITRDPSLDELYGLAPGMAATFEEWAELVHPDDRATVLAEVDRVLAGHGAYHFEHRLVRPDGQVRWLERRGHVYTDGAGRMLGLRGMVIDITDRKVAELERAVLFERVTRLQAVTAALAHAGTPGEVIDTMVDQGVEAAGASAGSVAVLDEAGETLDVVRAGGYPAELVEQFGRIPLAADVPLADVVRTRSPLWFDDIDRWGERYPDLATRVARAGHRAVAALPLVVDDRVLGAVGLSYDGPQPFDLAQRELVGAVVAQCAQALDRARSYAGEAAARHAAERARARLALLADASIILAGSMEYEATLPEVARLAIPVLGDCCVVDVFGDARGDGRPWRRVAVAGVDRHAWDRLSAIPPEPWAGTDVVDGAATLRDLGLEAGLVVPLEARGRAVGVLAVGRARAESFTDADRSLATGLATRVAQAVDNALLYRAERRAHHDAETAALRMAFLLDVSTALTSGGDVDHRLELLAERTAAAVADVCLIDLVERDGSIRRVAASTAADELRPGVDALRRLLHPDPQSPHPSAAAIRTGRTELCPEVTEDRLRAITSSPAHLDAARSIEPISYVAVPLLGVDRVLGAITLITTARSGRRYGGADLALVEDMGTRVAMGLEAATMHEDMRRVAQTLQASLLPSVPPSIPGLEVGTRYVAAGAGTVVGGDFYDVFAVGSGSWAVVVGDVCGQGVEAATVTGLARHTLRSSALDHESPAAVLSHLNDVLLRVAGDAPAEVDPRFCTVCLGRISVSGEGVGAALTVAVGGHPLPFLLRADGSVAQVGRPGSLLGVMEPADLVDEDHAIGPGDALVLYTDGVTERHHGTSFFGEEGLARVLAGSAGLSADEIAGRVEDAVRRFVGGQMSDDLAVVVVRVPVPAG